MGMPCRAESEERLCYLENVADNQTKAEELEEAVMGALSSISGQARSPAYGAPRKAKEGDLEAAKAMMDQSRIALTKRILCRQNSSKADQGEAQNKSQARPVHALRSFDDLNAGS